MLLQRKRMGTPRTRALITATARFIIAGAVAAAPVPACAELDMGRLVLGRVMYPAKSWAFDTFYGYKAPQLRSAAADSLKTQFELERGEFDRFGWEVGLETSGARHAQHFSRVGAGARALLLDAPFDLSFQGEWLPSLHDEAPEWELELEALKNVGAFSIVAQPSLEIEQGRKLKGSIIAGPLARFGLNGVLGAQAEYSSDGSWSGAGVVGGAVGRNLFLSFQPRFGLNARAPDFQLLLELHALFGSYALGAWGLR